MFASLFAISKKHSRIIVLANFPNSCERLHVLILILILFLIQFLFMKVYVMKRRGIFWIT